LVDITSAGDDRDVGAVRRGWQRLDHNRAFRVEHCYYDRQQIDGWDYDIGAQRVRTATAANERPRRN